MKARVQRGTFSLRTGIFVTCALCVLGGTCLGWWPVGGWVQGGWLAGISLRSYDSERLPYYALFPPVYYSHPIRHPYGHSPFARLPELPSVLEVRSEGPLAVKNPFCGLESPRPKDETPGSGPLVVKNPHFGQEDKTGLDKAGEIATLTAPSK